MDDSRLIAAKCLADILRGKSSLSNSRYLSSKHLPTGGTALTKELCYGVCRYQPRLSACIDQLLNKPLRQKDSDLYALMLIGCYQLSYLRIPDHAAIDSCVSCCDTLKKSWAKKLVNGVLRQYQRRSEELLQSLHDWQLQSHPQWLAEQLRLAWPRQFESIVEANNQHPPFILRVNTQKQSREDYLSYLTEDSSASRCTYASDGIVLAKAKDVTQLPGFAQGWISVQDEAAQFAADLINVQSGQKVLDACAAPGGKTAHILERTPDCQLTALDHDEGRCQQIQENLQRLELNCTVICADAGNIEGWWDRQTFDAILLDAPCSATGVIRRHPDIKLLRRKDDIGKLAAQQLHLLTALWPTLNPGGRLIYATCSILPQENETVIDQFLSQTKDAISCAINTAWGEPTGFGRQLLPQPGGHDGFYYAHLEKKSYN